MNNLDFILESAINSVTKWTLGDYLKKPISFRELVEANPTCFLKKPPVMKMVPKDKREFLNQYNFEVYLKVPQEYCNDYDFECSDSDEDDIDFEINPIADSTYVHISIANGLFTDLSVLEVFEDEFVNEDYPNKILNTAEVIKWMYLSYKLGKFKSEKLIEFYN